jgi:hypothetical protein
MAGHSEPEAAPGRDEEREREERSAAELPATENRKREALGKGQEASAQVDENVSARGPANIQKPKIDRTSGQPQKWGKPEAVTGDRKRRVQPEETSQGNGREQKGLQAGQQGAKPLPERTGSWGEGHGGRQNEAAERAAGSGPGGRLSNKPNAQPIHDEATQDLRSVAVKAQENSVEQPNKEPRRPPQNRQTKKALPPPLEDAGQPQHPQQEQQGKKKKKPEDKPPGQ